MITFFRMITHPFARKLPRRKCFLIIGAITVSAILANVYQMDRLIYSEGFCWIEPKTLIHGFIYFSCFEIAKMFVPITILMIFYTLSALAIQNNQGVSQGNQRRLRRNRQVVKMFVTIVIIFFLCKGPYSFFRMTETYTVTFKQEEWDKVKGGISNVVLFAVSSINSIINPMVYARMHRDLRGPLKKLFKRMLQRSSNRSDNQATSLHRRLNVKHSRNMVAMSSKEYEQLMAQFDSKTTSL